MRCGKIKRFCSHYRLFRKVPGEIENENDTPECFKALHFKFLKYVNLMKYIDKIIAFIPESKIKVKFQPLTLLHMGGIKDPDRLWHPFRPRWREL